MEKPAVRFLYGGLVAYTQNKGPIQTRTTNNTHTKNDAPSAQNMSIMPSKAHTRLLFLTMLAHQETHTPIEVGDILFI